MPAPSISPQYVKEHADELTPSSHMALSIQNGVYIVPIKHGCICVSLPVSALTAHRIAREGGVDIDGSKYWVSIHDAEVFFRGTDERVPLIHGLF